MLCITSVLILPESERTFLGFGQLPLFLQRWRLNLLTLSEPEVQSLGVNTKRLRLVLILCATLATSASVAVSGMIGWVGLVIPHFCRPLFGADTRHLLPAAMLISVALRGEKHIRSVFGSAFRLRRRKVSHLEDF